MIQIDGLGLRRGGRWLLQEIDLHLRPGSITGLLGPPEAGKTLLLKALAGLQPFDVGRIVWDPEPLRPDGTPAVGFAFQNNALFDDLTVFDNVALPLRYAQVPEADIAARVQQRLEDVELVAARDQLPRALSGGMQKRLGVARATIGAPRLGLFDEPTAGLDPQTAGRIVGLLEKLSRSLQMATVLVSHDLPAILPACHRVSFLHAGRQVFDGERTALSGCAHPVVRQFMSGAVEGPL